MPTRSARAARIAPHLPHDRTITMRRLIALLAATGALVLAFAASAFAAFTPGAVSFRPSGVLLQLRDDDLAEDLSSFSLSWPGTIDAAGNLTFPGATFGLPGVPVSDIGATVTIGAASDMTGRLDETTGEVTLTGDFQVILRFAAPVVATCTIPLPGYRFTTDGVELGTPAEPLPLAGQPRDLLSGATAIAAGVARAEMTGGDFCTEAGRLLNLPGPLGLRFPGALNLPASPVRAGEPFLFAPKPSFPTQTAQTIGAARPVTVTNHGDQPLDVEELWVEGANADDFLVSSQSCTRGTVAPGASCSVSIRFAPSAANTVATAALVLSANTAAGEHRVGLAASSSGLPIGEPGEPGFDGVDGLDGADGRDGADGADGRDGAAGPRGATGQAGPAGAAGFNGYDGWDGAPGPAGPAGSVGRPGPAGRTGPRGARGPAGRAAARNAKARKAAQKKAAAAKRRRAAAAKQQRAKPAQQKQKRKASVNRSR